MNKDQTTRNIIKMRRAGHILTDIALEMDCSLKIVTETLDKFYKTRQQERQEVKDKIVSLSGQGYNGVEISEKVGCSCYYVYEVLKVHRNKKG